MKSKNIIGLSVMLLGMFLVACKADTFFQNRRYYGDGGTWIFYPDNAYQYIDRTEGLHVYKFSKGTWKQDGNKLFLTNTESNPGELPMSIRTSPSIEPETQLVVNILPKRNMSFAYLPSTTDLLNIELVVDKIIYPLENETNIVRFLKPVDHGYFRAYWKSDVDATSEILNDTLQSKYINLRESKNKILSIDVDCNPMYFAQIKMPDDTLRIISKHKIKRNKTYLRGPRE